MNGNLADKTFFLLDMDGTFYLGDKLVDGALDFINIVRQQGKDFIFLTNNSSRNARQYAEKISRLGLPIPAEKVFTSGEATAVYLCQFHPEEKIYLVGTPALEEVFRQHQLILSPQEPDLVVLGFDTTLTYQKLWDLCKNVKRGLPYIATHPDINCPTRKGFMPDIGAVIAYVRASTGRDPDIVIGKPNRIIIDLLASKYGRDLQDMAVIGDRLYTDIALGQTAGIVTCLVLSGETRRQDLENSTYQPSFIFAHLGEVAAWLTKHPG